MQVPSSTFIKLEPSCVKRKPEKELNKRPSKVTKVSQSILTQNPVAMDIDNFNFIKAEPGTFVKSENEENEFQTIASSDVEESDFEEPIDTDSLVSHSQNYALFTFLMKRKEFKSSLMLMKQGDREAVIEKYNESHNTNVIDYNKAMGMVRFIRQLSNEDQLEYLHKYFTENPDQASKEIVPATFAEISEYWCPESYALLCHALEFYALKTEKPNWVAISLFVGNKRPRACYIMAWYLKEKYNYKFGELSRNDFHSFISLIPFRNNTGIFWKYLEKAVGVNVKRLKKRYNALLTCKIDLPKNPIQFFSSGTIFDRKNALYQICENGSNSDWVSRAQEFNQIADLELDSGECERTYIDLKQLDGTPSSSQDESFLTAVLLSTQEEQINWENIAEITQLTIEECQIKHKWHCMRKEGTATSRFYRLLKLHIGCILVFHQHALAKKGEENDQFQVDLNYIIKKFKKLFPDFVIDEKGISDLIHLAKSFSCEDREQCIATFYQEFSRYEKLKAYLVPSQTSEWSEEEVDRLQNALKSVKEKPNWVKISRAVQTKNCFDCKKKSLNESPSELNHQQLGALIFFNEFSALGRSSNGQSDSKYVVQKYNKYFDQNLTVNHLNQITERQISKFSDSERAKAKEFFLKNNPQLKIKVDFLTSEAQFHPSIKKAKTSTSWTEVEIKLLKLLRKKYVSSTNSWEIVAARLKTKDTKQCKNKWFRLNKSSHSYHPAYTDEENGCLIYFSKIKNSNKEIMSEFNKHFPKRQMKDPATICKHLKKVNELSALDKKRCEEVFRKRLNTV